jgi:alanine racemase
VVGRVGLPLRCAHVELAAIAHNLRRARAVADDAEVFADVSADGYGHGAVPVARAAVAAGARGLLVDTVEEGVSLREAGIGSPILARLPEDFQAAAERRITPMVGSPAALEEACRAAVASVQLAVALGDGVIGCREFGWTALVAHAARLERETSTRVAGVIGLPAPVRPRSRSDRASVDTVRMQFGRRIAAARGAGLLLPERMLVEQSGLFQGGLGRGVGAVLGGALYGLSPFTAEPAAGLGLVPAMRLSARVVETKTVGAGEGVSYGYTYRTSRASTLALVAIGYAQGVCRAAGNRCRVRLNGEVYPIAGRVAMDAFVLDLGEAAAEPGDEAVLFGDPRAGEPGVESWAGALGMSPEEVVVSVSPQVARSYL